MLAPAVAVLAAEHVDPGPALAAGGVTHEELQEPTRRVTIQAATRVWQAALRAVPDANFGLRAARLVESGDADVLSCLARSCSTLEESLRFFARFGSLLDETLECSLRSERGGSFFSFGRRSIHYLPAVADYAALRLVLLGRKLLGADYGLLEVRFPHARPKSLSPHREAFGAPLRFEQEELGLLLEPRALAAPVPSADPVLKGVLVTYAERLLPAAGRAAGAAQRVRDTMLELLPHGFPTRDLVASRMGISERTLARMLDAEQTNFKLLVEELRLELAQRRLQDGRAPIGQIAAELGFQDQSAFTKFFKRHAGALPVDYRKRYRFRDGTER